MPYVPVPGNHDWYDDGATWKKRYGPDNYSFDVGDVHFVVWNMAMTDAENQAYLGAELAFVDHRMTIVALTHAPPTAAVTAALRDLGVAYVLTGHTHSNRLVDHDGVIELQHRAVADGRTRLDARGATASPPLPAASCRRTTAPRSTCRTSRSPARRPAPAPALS